MSSIYISLEKDKSFHTIIIKKKIKEFTFVAAIGYCGGRVYEEFFGKLKYDQATADHAIQSIGITGFWTDSVGSDEWQEKINDILVVQDSKKFEAQVEDLYEFMDADDTNIRFELSEEMRKFIYAWYDEETEREYEIPILKDIDFSGFTEHKESENGTVNGYVFWNKEWDNDFMEITTSNIWRMSYHFPSIIENYL